MTVPPSHSPDAPQPPWVPLLGLLAPHSATHMGPLSLLTCCESLTESSD